MNIALVWFFLLSLVLAKLPEVYEPKYTYSFALTGCLHYISQIGTFCSDSLYTYNCPCINDNARASYMGCLEALGVADELHVNGSINECALSSYDIQINATAYWDSLEDYRENAINSSTIEGFNTSELSDYPLLVDAAQCKRYEIAYVNFLGTYYNSIFYGAGCLAYWPVVMLVATIFHTLSWIAPNFMKRRTGKVTNWVRSKIILPAVNRRKTELKPFLKFFHLMVPSRIETIILVGYLVLIIASCGAQIRYQKGDPVFSSATYGLAKYVAVRCGIIASFAAPLLILFGGRNNFLQWITGWHYGTFIMYHRWIARVVVALVIVHSVGYSIAYLKVGGYKAVVNSVGYSMASLSDNGYKGMWNTNAIWGTIGTISGSFILIQGLLVLRRKAYEIFLLIHIILASLFIAGAWYHVKTFGYGWWYASAIAVWAFDRFVRFIRLFLFGFPTAEVVLVADETLKVTIPKPSYWKPIPGGHAFIHFIRPTCFWQSHPFTFTTTEEDTNIVLYCKVKGGVTHSLYKQLRNTPSRSAKLRVAVEGPYGSSTPARYFDSAVFIAGGNGIPGIYSEAIALAKSGTKQTIKLYWIIRHIKSLEWFEDELKAIQGLDIQPIIYITQSEFNLLDSSDGEKKELLDSSDEKETLVEARLPHVSIRKGRPDAQELVQLEFEESLGSVAFITCGHPAQVDDLRYHVSRNLHPKKRVEFFEQLQVW